MMVNEIRDFVNGLAEDELYALVREVRTRLAADGSASRRQGTMDEEEWDSLLDYAASARSADEIDEEPQGLTDVTKQMSETQRVAPYKLLTELDPDARCIDWDNENPAEFDEIELARLCFLKAWPLDDWNRRYDAGRVERWRGGVGFGIFCFGVSPVCVSIAACRAPFPPSAHRTGRADFPHPALGQGSWFRPRVATRKALQVQQSKLALQTNCRDIG